MTLSDDERNPDKARHRSNPRAAGRRRRSPKRRRVVQRRRDPYFHRRCWCCSSFGWLLTHLLEDVTVVAERVADEDVVEDEQELRLRDLPNTHTHRGVTAVDDIRPAGTQHSAREPGERARRKRGGAWSGQAESEPRRRRRARRTMRGHRLVLPLVAWFGRDHTSGRRCRGGARGPFSDSSILRLSACPILTFSHSHILTFSHPHIPTFSDLILAGRSSCDPSPSLPRRLVVTRV